MDLRKSINGLRRRFSLFVALTAAISAPQTLWAEQEVVDRSRTLPAAMLAERDEKPTGGSASASRFVNSESSAGSQADLTESEQLWLLLERLSQQLTFALRDSRQQADPHLQIEDYCNLPDPAGSLVSALNEQAKHYSEDLGLKVNGYYASSVTEDDGTNQRGYLELSWDLLNEGYQNNRKEADTYQVRAQIEALRGEMARQERVRNCQRNAVHALFTPLRKELLSIKLQLAEPVHQLEKRAYFKGWSFLDDLLVSEQELLLTRRELAYLQTAPQFQGLSLDDRVYNPPIVDIDIERVLDAIRDDLRPKRLYELQQQLVTAQRTKEDRNRLRLFLRQEVDDGGSPDDVVTGMRFSLPLEGQRKEELEYWLRHTRDNYQLDSWERLSIVQASYLEYREQLERVIKQHYNLRRNQERVRRSLAERRLGDDRADLTVAITRMLGLLTAAEELAATKEVLYRRSNDLLMKAKLEYRDEFFRLVPLDDSVRGRIGARSLYVWSDTFNTMDNALLLELLHAKGVHTIVLSAGRKTDHRKLDAFLDHARTFNVELLLGTPEWVRPENHLRAVATAARVAEKADRLHLDIEPHTLPEYAADRDTYLSDYVDLLRKIRKAVPEETRLTIAVPLHWPIAVYGDLLDVVDEYSLMAYEIKETSSLIRRLVPLINALPADRMRLVLRARDFEDEWDIEQRFQAVAEKTPIHKFGIHDLGQLLSLMGEDIETANP